MPSILPQELIGVARDVAFELGLPWRVGDLWKVGEAHGTTKAPPGNLGLPTGGADEQARRTIRVRGHVEKAGKGMGRLPPGLSEPADEQIRVALLTFTVGQWRDLIDRFDQDDTDALLSYLHANEGPLKHRLGYSNFFAIYGYAIRRHLIHSGGRPEMRFVFITDAYEAARLHKIARQHNIGTAPKPPGRRSWDERSRPYYISEEMGGPRRKVSRHTAAQILKRLKQTSPQDFDGSIQDYLTWATDPKAYERVLAARKAGTKPPRRPDPYFSDEN